MDDYISKPVGFAMLKETLKDTAEGTDSSPLDNEWNLGLALDRVEGDEGLLRELLGIFIERWPGLNAALRAAAGEHKPGELQSIAHTLKGELACLAAEPAAELAAQIEHFGSQEDWEQVGITIAELESRVTRLRPAWGRYRRAHEAASG